MAWRSSPYGTVESGTASLFVSNLPAEITQEQVANVFGPFGSMAQCKVMPSWDGSSTAAALVRFSSDAEGKSIKDMLDGNIPQGLIDPVSIVFWQQPIPGGGEEYLQETTYAAAAAPEGGMSAEEQRQQELVRLQQQEAEEAAAAAAAVAGVTMGYDFPNPAPAVAAPPEKGFGKACGKGSKGGTCVAPMDIVVQGFESSGGLPGGTSFVNDEGAIFVGSLASDCTDLDLYRLFASFGPIAPRGVKAMVHPDGITCKGFGFVNYLSGEAAQSAISTLDGTVLPDGVILKVTQKREGGGKKGGKGGKGKSKGKW